MAQELYCIDYSFYPLGTFYAREEQQLKELTALLDHKIKQNVQQKRGGFSDSFLDGLRYAFYPLSDPEGNLGRKSEIKMGLQSFHGRSPDMQLTKCSRGSLYVDLWGSKDLGMGPLLIPLCADFELAVPLRAVESFRSFQRSLEKQQDDEVQGLYKVVTGASSVYFVHYIPVDVREVILNLDCSLLVSEAKQLPRPFQPKFDTLLLKLGCIN